MAGVIQEIDLVLSQQALARLEGDLARVSARIGTGIAAGATPAAQTYAKNLITTLETRLRTESTVLARQLAEGALSPAKYAVAAERLGKEIIRDLNRGIKAGGNLELFGGEGGIALKNQLSSLSAIPPIVDRVGGSVAKATPLVTGLRASMFSLASTAAGVPGPLGRIAGLLLTFTGGAGVAVLAAAAIGLIAIAFDKLTAASAKAREETKKFLESTKDLGKTGDEIAKAEIQETENRIRRSEVRLEGLRRIAERFATSPTARKAVEEEIAVLKELEERLATQIRLRDEQNKQLNESARAGPDNTQETLKAEKERLEAQKRTDKEIAADRKRAAEEAARERKRAIAEELREQKQLAAARASLAKELQQQLAALTSTAVDDLEIEINQLQRRIIETFGAVPAEVQPLLDGMRERLRNLKFLEPLDQEIEALKPKIAQAGEAIKQGLGAPAIELRPVFDALLTKLIAQRDTLKEHSAEWQKITDRINEVLGLQGSLLEGVGDASITLDKSAEKTSEWADELGRVALAAVELADALGIVDDRTASVLRGISEIALNAGKALSGDPAAIAGVLGGVGATLGGLFGESPEAKALRESMEKNERAIRDLSENIKQLDLTITGTGLLAAGRGLGGALGAAGVFPGLVGASGAASARADADALDRALREAGSSLTELQDIANSLGIDIDELTRGQLTQLQRAIQEVDLTAFTRTLEGQLSVFQRFARQAGLTATETLTGIVGRARGTSEAFDKVFQGLDLSTKEGLEAAHERIVQALREVPLLTAEQLGDLSVEGYLALLDEAGGLVSQGLDDLGQAILDAAREAEEAAQEAADLSRRRIGSRRDINELLDRTDPLEIIKGIAGGVPQILQDALSGLDLTREADRDRLDALIQSLFAQLSTGQLERGGLLEGMAPEDFRNLLLEWERLLDEQRQNEADAAERAATEAEQRQRDRERAAEEARREAERLEREREQRERDRLEAKRDAEQLLVDERLALEEQAELRALEKRARSLGGDPVRAIEEALRLFAEATRLGGGELGADSPLARDARRRALEAQREAERQIEQGERLLGEVVTPGFTVQRTITESSAGHLISELQLQTNWLQRIYERLGGVGNPVINVQPTVAGRGVAGGASEISIDVSRDLAAEFQRAALLNGNAEMR